MQVFISFSGEKSKKIAEILYDWLPCVIPSIKPVFSEEFEKSGLWIIRLFEKLENSSFGIVCVTENNINSPWLEFEAGMLAYRYRKEQSTLIPFLIDLKPSALHGPLAHFQSTIFDKRDIMRMMNTLNNACGSYGVPPSHFNAIFNKWYPDLRDRIYEVYNEDALTENEHKSDEDLTRIRDAIQLLKKFEAYINI